MGGSTPKPKSIIITYYLVRKDSNYKRIISFTKRKKQKKKKQKQKGRHLKQKKCVIKSVIVHAPTREHKQQH